MKTKAWSRRESRERFPGPVTPMGWSALRPSLEQNLDNISSSLGLRRLPADEVVRSFGGHVYTREPFFSSLAEARPRASVWLSLLGHLAGVVLRHVASRPSLVWRLPRALRSGRRFGASFADPVFSFWMDVYEACLAPRARQVVGEWRAELPACLARLDESDARYSKGDFEEPRILAALDELDAKALSFMRLDFSVYFLKGAVAAFVKQALAAEGVVEGQAGLDDGLVAFLQGMEGHPLHEAHAEIRARGEGAAAFAAERYGHLTDDWDLAVPTLRDFPERVRAMVSQAFDPLAALRLERSRFLRRARRRSFLERARAAGLESRLAALLDDFEGLARADEEHRFWAARQYPAARNLLLSAGRKLARRSLLSSADDVFFLELAELKEALRGVLAPGVFAERVKRRRLVHERALLASPAELLDAEGRAVPAQGGTLPVFVSDSADASRWKGVPASPGRAEGRVRLIRGLADFENLIDGEIAVTIAPNPLFASYYGRLAGLVTETGGSLSHGILTAREFSLPAVIGVRGAMERLRNGDLLRLDGSSGEIRLL
jgi:phosphohistidine swiveling domain-containing protein